MGLGDEPDAAAGVDESGTQGRSGRVESLGKTVPNKPLQATAKSTPRLSGISFGHGGAGDDPEFDRIAKILADAQRPGHRVLDFIRTSNNFAQVSRWWAALVDLAIKDR